MNTQLKAYLPLCILLMIGCNLLTNNLAAQGSFVGKFDNPKREFRGVWVSTVYHLDYPRRPTTWPTAHRENWKFLLKQYKKVGINAVIVQVRPAGDAFYQSKFAPWSAFLTGKQGEPLDGNFDLLKFMIEETHKQGMEFHAWLNPFRATTSKNLDDTLKLSRSHAFYQHRNWMVKYDNRFYFNPALEEVRTHLLDVVTELVQNYEIDAVHFDDYFYPYPVKGEVFQDSTQFRIYGSKFDDIADWRRDNVNDIIRRLSEQIKAIKPNMQFGISPFGVWRNKKDDPMGSPTRAGVTNYDDLYADVLRWSRMEWIDYIAPQIYWHIGFDAADHAKLLRWWSGNNYSSRLYIGHGLHKVGTDQRYDEWHDEAEVPKQIRLNRQILNAQGSIHFRSESLLRNRLGVKDSIQAYYKKPALLPEIEQIESVSPVPPKLRSVKAKSKRVKIKWRPGKSKVAGRTPHYYAVYRFRGTDIGDLEDGNNLVAVTSFNPKRSKLKIIDQKCRPNQYYTYVVTALNDLHKESGASNHTTIFKTLEGGKKFKGQF